jgi:hypothetical protein
VRSNDVVGGLKFVNERTTAVSVTVRAQLSPGGTQGTATPTPLGGGARRAGRFTIPAESTATSSSFFDAPGTWVVEAEMDDSRARGRITLHRTLLGGLGVDTVVITTPLTGGVELEVTDVD